MRFFLIEVELIHNVVLISTVQQTDSEICIYMYILFLIFLSIMGYHRILKDAVS